MRTRITLQPKIIQRDRERQGSLFHPCSLIFHHAVCRFPLTDMHDTRHSDIVSDSSPQPNKKKSSMKNQTAFTNSLKIASLKEHSQ